MSEREENYLRLADISALNFWLLRFMITRRWLLRRRLRSTTQTGTRMLLVIHPRTFVEARMLLLLTRHTA